MDKADYKVRGCWRAVAPLQWARPDTQHLDSLLLPAGNAVTNGEVHQSFGARTLELVSEGFAMFLDGADTQAKVTRDVLICQTFGYHFQNFDFLSRKLLNPISTGVRCSKDEILLQESSDTGAEIITSLEHFLNCAEQFAGRTVLQNNSGNICFNQGREEIEVALSEPNHKRGSRTQV